jgi:hypothetical protein
MHPIPDKGRPFKTILPFLIATNLPPSSSMELLTTSCQKNHFPLKSNGYKTSLQPMSTNGPFVAALDLMHSYL